MYRDWRLGGESACGPNREILCKRGVMRVRKVTDWETDLGAQISVLLVFSSSLLLSAFWLAGGGLGNGPRGSN